MLLRPITDGSISGTGVASCPSRIIGGVLVSADGTNAATIILRTNDSSGKRFFHVVVKSPVFITGPFGAIDGNASTPNVYYDISGTNASAQLYEWVE